MLDCYLNYHLSNETIPSIYNIKYYEKITKDDTSNPLITLPPLPSPPLPPTPPSTPSLRSNTTLEHCAEMCRKEYNRLQSIEPCILGCHIAYNGYLCDICRESFTIFGFRKCEIGCNYYLDRNPTNTSYTTVFFPDCINISGVNYVFYNGKYYKGHELFNNHPVYHGPTFTSEGVLVQRGIIYYNYINGYTLGPQSYNPEMRFWRTPVSSYLYHNRSENDFLVGWNRGIFTNCNKTLVSSTLNPTKTSTFPNSTIAATLNATTAVTSTATSTTPNSTIAATPNSTIAATPNSTIAATPNSTTAVASTETSTATSTTPTTEIPTIFTPDYISTTASIIVAQSSKSKESKFNRTHIIILLITVIILFVLVTYYLIKCVKLVEEHFRVKTYIKNSLRETSHFYNPLYNANSNSLITVNYDLYDAQIYGEVEYDLANVTDGIDI